LIFLSRRRCLVIGVILSYFRRRRLVLTVYSSRHLIVRRRQRRPLSRYVHLITPCQHDLSYRC